MVKSAYIHIPFCKSKCHYCSFVSFDKLNLKKEYLKTLAREINYYYDNEILNTLYFGGGTPSLLTISEFENIIRIFNINDKTEITTELNPENLTYEYLRGLYDLGINRLSLGCQSFDDEILKQINRRHNAGQVINAVKLAEDAGFKNISLDFIYGLPDQTPQMFYKDLERAIQLGIPHISLYGLKVEEGCYFYEHMPKNLPDEDMQADMYLGAIELLTGSGFEHYEISNFSRPKFNSKHNLTYWNNEEYYGFGVAAHGYINGIRYGNIETIDEYLNNYLARKESHIVTEREKQEEEIFLGFRKISEGINTSVINKKYNMDFDEKYKDILKKYIYLNMIEKIKSGYKLTPQGVLVSNVVLADFLE